MHLIEFIYGLLVMMRQLERKAAIIAECASTRGEVRHILISRKSDEVAAGVWRFLVILKSYLTMLIRRVTYSVSVSFIWMFECSFERFCGQC